MLGSQADHRVGVQTSNSDGLETIHQQQRDFHAKSEPQEIILRLVQIPPQNRIYWAGKIRGRGKGLRSLFPAELNAFSAEYRATSLKLPAEAETGNIHG